MYTFTSSVAGSVAGKHSAPPSDLCTILCCLSVAQPEENKRGPQRALGC